MQNCIPNANHDNVTLVTDEGVERSARSDKKLQSLPQKVSHFYS
jgi:hypothetical protein